MKKSYLIIVFIGLMMLAGCGGGGGGSVSGTGSAGDTSAGSGDGSKTSSSTGTVALFVTDSLSEFKQVATSITGVEILNKGSGASCSVLSAPVDLNIAELASEFLLLDIATCPEDQYNRIHVETGSTVELTDQNDATSTCAFVSYKDNENKPNVLHCTGDTCSMEINGMVNVLVNQNSTLTLDFDLKEFEVENFGTPQCTVTMKVEPLNSNDINEKKNKGLKESLDGFVTDLDPAAQSFILTKKTDFTVLYGNISEPGLNDLLQFAQDNHLKTKVTCSELDLATSTCTASEITVNVDGTLSDITPTTFTLTFNPAIPVDYSTAEVEGILSENVRAEAKLYGYDGTNYLAGKVEVEDDEDKGHDDADIDDDNGDSDVDQEKEIEGHITSIDSVTYSFTVTEDSQSYSVLYGDVTQPGIAALLEFIYTNNLEAEISCLSFEISSLTCMASEIHGEVEGIVSDLTSSIFTLTFNPFVSVNYSTATVTGVLADDAEAEVILYGFDGTDYLAREVEVEN